ncbi:hypothetical protein [Polyangium sp. y55x31]|uniref:hypothetical protein n=1 Tax=Polyangium sp. y55x31 TaxID=3042688 RepID=UPI002482229A|nr:hypothetical protein [Polyangium sp. y55x31]MDI1484383.1 hypothetical protein [Polyangium sp. y55x31]
MKHREPTGLEGQSSAFEPDVGGHPLFPRQGTGGAATQAEPSAPAAELRSWEQLIELYGGEGTFQLAGMYRKRRSEP